MARVNLFKSDFAEYKKCVAELDDLSVSTFKYATGIESVTLKNSQGYVEILPYMGQIIWDLNFKGKSLKLHNIFDMPRKAQSIVDTYGCFAFHSGLLANGCPSDKDNHPLHGEFSVIDMYESYLDIGQDYISIVSVCDYCKGFGYHYEAVAKVTLKSAQSYIDISLDVLNKTCTDMPLQYMCHMNYAYFDKARMSCNIPASAFVLRKSIPSHVHPTAKWLAYAKELDAMHDRGETLEVLANNDMYDPEIVFMADNVSSYVKDAVFEMHLDDGSTCFVSYDTADFNSVTRWIMYNDDLKVAAFALPATCRPEGAHAAREAGTLIYLKPGQSRSFKVRTGLR